MNIGRRRNQGRVDFSIAYAAMNVRRFGSGDCTDFSIAYAAMNNLGRTK